ncbi:MAG TPA: glycosyltransferase family 2 protein [Acidimicrobiales bacterium]|nr:glycosyltransferase family 2 protein [Acidimicrobiales bacterium]
MASTINLAFRREVFDAAGGLDESFAAAEDLDFTWRLTDRGCRIRWVQDAVVKHDWGTQTRQVGRAFFYGGGWCRLIRKHPRRIGEVMKLNSVAFVYPLYLLGLPLTARWRWYPLMILWPVLCQRKVERPGLVLLDHLAVGAGVLYGLMRPGT